MSTNTSITNSVPKEIPTAPQLEELYIYYKSVKNNHLIKTTFQNIRRSHFKKKKSLNKDLKIVKHRGLTQIQFVSFIKELGLPDNYKQSDFPFLDGVEIF